MRRFRKCPICGHSVCRVRWTGATDCDNCGHEWNEQTMAMEKRAAKRQVYVGRHPDGPHPTAR